MDSGPTRIEIELEPHEPSRGRRSTRHESMPVAGADPAPVDPSAPPPDLPRRQLVTVGLAVGVVALFLGWTLGRAGGDEAPAGEPAPATSVAVTTAPPTSVGATGDTLPAAELPTTTRPRSTTTSTLPPIWVEGTVEVDPRLAGQDARIVAFTENGLIVELDVGSGVLRVLPVSGSPSNGSPPVAGDGWVMMPAVDGTVRVFTDDSPRPEPIVAPVNDGSSIFWQYGTNRFWRPEYDDEIQGTRVHEIGIDGRRTGRELDTHGFWPVQGDPAGGVIVGDEQMGVFAVDDAGSRRLPGRVIAISADHVLTFSCKETLGSCGLQRLDRASGEITDVPAPPERDAAAAQLYSGWWSAGSSAPTISSDGRAAVVPVPTETGSGLAVLDLATGVGTLFESPPSAATFYVPSGGFSADGRFAYVSDRGVLTAFDGATGESFPVAAGIPDVATLTVRPPAPAG